LKPRCILSASGEGECLHHDPVAADGEGVGPHDKPWFCLPQDVTGFADIDGFRNRKTVQEALRKTSHDMAMAMLMRRMNVGQFTAHGFRSSFRDWAAEETLHAREVAEAALAHVYGDATERAYRRGDALAKRRALMTDWGIQLSTTRAGKVIKLDDHRA
jgi:hypothetical protein